LSVSYNDGATTNATKKKNKIMIDGEVVGNSPFFVGDVVNQQTHFTCNEDPTRAALVISTI